MKVKVDRYTGRSQKQFETIWKIFENKLRKILLIYYFLWVSKVTLDFKRNI